LSFFTSLSPSLEWHASVACYSHPIDISGVEDAVDDSSESDSESDEESQPISYERVLELREAMRVHHEEERKEDVSKLHARPFFGSLDRPCGLSDCLVTPLPGGRFYHRCTTSLHSAAPIFPAATDLADASPSPSASPSAVRSQAALACRGWLVWSPHNSLNLSIDGRQFVPSPFAARGVWAPSEEIQAEQMLRKQWMEQQGATQVKEDQPDVKQEADEESKMKD
jgi:hypothetical protein